MSEQVDRTASSATRRYKNGNRSFESGVWHKAIVAQLYKNPIKILMYLHLYNFTILLIRLYLVASYKHYLISP